MQFHLYVPQMRMTGEQLVERARAAEAAGFDGIAGMDHMAPPMAEAQDMFEAMVTNTWLAAATSRLVVSSLVLCDGFRHPALLAKEAATLACLSGGRFELGLGWGSVGMEFAAFGISDPAAAMRVDRMRESLDVLEALWTGEAVDYQGEHLQLRNARQAPRPLGRIPIVIGGSGRKTMALVRRYATWWNLHLGLVDQLDQLRPSAGNARVSIQQMVAFVADPAKRAGIEEPARKRFAAMGTSVGAGAVIGEADELIEHYGALADRSVERVYVWFTDFAALDTITAFGAGVITPLAGSRSRSNATTAEGAPAPGRGEHNG